MAIYPHAVWRPLPENSTEPGITATQVILHTAVSGASSLWGYFARPDVLVESHFYVNRAGVEQYIDTAHQADANYHANVRAISIETWDDGDPEHTPWTPRQLDELVALVAWCCATHGIPAVQCPDWDAPGIGWHVMFGAPGPWTPVSKSCPGGPRIAQMPELIARVQAAITGQPQEDDMPTIEEIEAAAYRAAKRVDDEGTAGGTLSGAATRIATLKASQLTYNAVIAGNEADAAKAEEILAAVAEQLSPEEIAAAIPDGLAEDVLTALAGRLAS